MRTAALQLTPTAGRAIGSWFARIGVHFNLDSSALRSDADSMSVCGDLSWNRNHRKFASTRRADDRLGTLSVQSLSPLSATRGTCAPRARPGAPACAHATQRTISQRPTAWGGRCICMRVATAAISSRHSKERIRHCECRQHHIIAGDAVLRNIVAKSDSNYAFARGRFDDARRQLEAANRKLKSRLANSSEWMAFESRVKMQQILVSKGIVRHEP